MALCLALALGLGACQDDVLGPTGDIELPDGGNGGNGNGSGNGNGGGQGGSGGLSSSTITPEGSVTQTASGYVVKGLLHLDTDFGRATFAQADLDVRFDANGNLRSMSGRAQIPSPHPRIQFADPVQADIGFFTGSELNRSGIIGIPLKNDTEYFVYRVATSFEMRIATGDTNSGAITPIAVRAPLGGEVIMVVDYQDPMYYIYGAQDLAGALGFGWSLHGRIPFVAEYPVQDMGAFDGKTTRTGTFPVFKIISVTGQIVENEETEVHVSLDDPFSSSLRMDYRMGFNGEGSLDLFLKDVAGIEVPLAAASGGMWREISTRDVFRGHAYVNGVTTNDQSWWPTFIPARPVQTLKVRSLVKSTGEFEVFLAGEYGWDLPSGRHSMSGEFSLTQDSMRVKGTSRAGTTELSLLGAVTREETRVGIAPPTTMLESIRGDVMQEVDARVAEAEKAWDDLQKATGDYELELSLRGLRKNLPGVVQTAKSELSSRISSELAKHKGKVYYDDLRSHLNSAAKPYHQQLDRLAAAAKQISDNDQTRKEIEAALRAVAAKKTYSTTFVYKKLGITLATVKVSARVLTDSQANTLINAANNVKYIKETSDRKIRMQQIYDSIPAKSIFEKVKQDIANGVDAFPSLSEFGFVLKHGAAKTFGVYAVLNGERHDLGALDPFDPGAVAKAVSALILGGWAEA
jgi:hypothetical protein